MSRPANPFRVLGAEIPPMIGRETLIAGIRAHLDNLQPEPRHALVWVRSIVDRALDLIWKRELKDGSTIPASWLEEWKRAGFQRLPDDGHGRLPRERGRQLGTLRFATGSGVRGQSIRRLTRDVTRPTVLLLDHLHEVGNFGQHQGDEVKLNFAASVCLSAITLCLSLGRDLDVAPTESDV